MTHGTAKPWAEAPPIETGDEAHQVLERHGSLWLAYARPESPLRALPSGELEGGSDGFAILRFDGLVGLTSGPPNDEALHTHPLYGHGLERYVVHEALGTPALVDAGAGTGHWIITFHDSTVEVLARSACVACAQFYPEGDDGKVLDEFLADATLQPGWGTNPSPDELRRWAYREGAMQPVVDFDLMATTEGNVPTILELASDPACPCRGFFLQCLYLLVGDAVRTGYRTTKRSFIESFLDEAEATRSADKTLAAWLRRSRELLAAPESFDYDLWCDGGYAAEAWEGVGA